MAKMRFRYRLLLFVGCTLLLVGFVKNKAVNTAEAEENNKDIVSEVIEEEKSVEEIQLSIYDGDYSSSKKKLSKLIGVNANDSLDKKVKTLMNGLSVALYNSLPIEVNVENWSGKEIAIVNLIEPLSQNKNEFNELYENLEDKSGTWRHFYETDANAKIFLISLQATLNQSDYEGTWIDGYKICHNGSTLECFDKSNSDIIWID